MKTNTNSSGIIKYVFLLASLFFSCEKDNLDNSFEEVALEEITQQPKEIKLEILNQQQINTNPVLLEELEKANTFIAKNVENNTLKKFTNLDLSVAIDVNQVNYTVLSDNVSHISYGDYHSYTFQMLRDSATDLIENLLLTLNQDGEYDAYVVSYDLTEEQKQLLIGSTTLELTDYATFTKLEDFNSEDFLRPTQEVLQDHISGYCYVETTETSRATGWEIVVREEVPCDNGGGGSGGGSSGGLGGGLGDGDAFDDDFPDGGGGSGSGGSGSAGTPDNGNCLVGPNGYCVVLITTPTGSSVTVPLMINTVYNKLDFHISSPSAQWLINEASLEELFVLYDYVNENSDLYGRLNDETKEFVREAVNILRSGNTNQKTFLNAILNDDIELATTILFENVEGVLYNSCPNPPCEGQFDAVVVLSVQIINNFFDGTVNTISFLGSPLRSSESRGRIVRNIMDESGIAIPIDVENETLGNLFKLRSRDRKLTFEPANEDFWESLSDIGISLLDIVTILSPSKGGGAFLFAKTGTGSITASSLSSYFKLLKQGKWKIVNESMSDAAKSYQELISGRSIRESFELKNVKFDGLRNGILAEAKSGMLNFVDQSQGRFKAWFNGGDALLDQARRQSEAAEGLPVEWHIEHKSVMDAIQNLFEDENFTNIFLIHTPR